MSGQRARWSVPADHRSVHPGIAGVPWWAAMLVAVSLTSLGFAFDAGSGNKELTGIFTAFYVLGCVTAVLAVRQSGLFTAMVQPPLILFCGVPGAYFVFHGSTYAGLRNLLINCGYPLIERFPLMLFTSTAVLLIGLARWFLGRGSYGPATDTTTATSAVATAAGAGLLAAVVGKLTSIWGGGSGDSGDKDAEPRPRRHTINRSARTDRTAERRPRRQPRTAASESTADRRQRRPRPTDTAERSDRTRRQRPARDVDPAEAPPRRRPRPPREPDREPGRTAGYERRERSTPRQVPYDPMDRVPPPRRPRVPTSPDRADATHHPVSRVRYRGSAATGSPDSWEYDI